MRSTRNRDFFGFYGGDVIKKLEKVQIIKWFISEYCCRSKIQTEAQATNNLSELENIVMSDRGYPHVSDCSTCWYEDTDGKYCYTCRDRSNYTFPYGYWKNVCERRGIKFDECK